MTKFATRSSLNAFNVLAGEDKPGTGSSGAKDKQATQRGAEQTSNSARRGTNKQRISARRGIGLISSLAIFLLFVRFSFWWISVEG